MRGTGKMLARHFVDWKPDLVWCHHGRAAATPDFLAELHRNRIPTAVYLCDEPYETGETAKYSPKFSHVFTMDPCTVQAHRHSRPTRRDVYYLPPGVDIFEFGQGRPQKDRKGVFFLGNATLTPREEWLRPIEKLVDGADIRFFESVGKNHPKWVDLDKIPELYGRCAVGLNVHRSPLMTRECYQRRVLARNPRAQPVPTGLKLCESPPRNFGTGFWNEGQLPAAHVNPRFFEMASCVTLVVSDNHRSELARMFPMAPRASDPAHFLELVRYYLQNEEEASSIARACSFQISKRHTYIHRAAEVLIRVGLKDLSEVNPDGFLGPQEVWLTPQDCDELGVKSFSDPIGPSERWSPAYGMSWINRSGSPSEADSLDAGTAWL